MNRPLPFVVLFVISLVLVSLLPLYLEQTMTRVMFVDGRGEAIDWGWKVCSLRTFFSDYRYFRRYPHPELWIALNIALAFVYALLLSLLVARILRRKPEAV
jgi:hypothetical protein